MVNVNESKKRTPFAWDKTIFILVNWGIMAVVYIRMQLEHYTPPPNKQQQQQVLSTSPLPAPIIIHPSETLHIKRDCSCKIPHGWTGQAGQDDYLFQRVFFQQSLCCIGTFVEFGARNGIEHSNTYIYERDMGWKGIMFEVDPGELPDLQRNRPGAHILQGPVCPSYQKNVTIAISRLGGWTGPGDTMEPTRKDQTRQEINYKCFHLATELRLHNMTRVDYMTIDTEGSELDIVLDFPWNDFDVRVVQIEQLVESRYPAQQGKKDRIISHMTSEKFGYKLLGVYQVARGDTDDLIFTRNLDDYLQMTNYMIGKSPSMTEERK